jgi:hypothetical protein
MDAPAPPPPAPPPPSRIDFKLNLQSPEQLREAQQFRAQELAIQQRRDAALGVNAGKGSKGPLGGSVSQVHVSASCPLLYVPEASAFKTSNIFRPPPPPGNVPSTSRLTVLAVPLHNPPVVGAVGGVPVQRPVSIDEGPFSAPQSIPALRPVALNQCIDLTSD